jgi:beta-lysine N6-acetyltransferase
MTDKIEKIGNSTIQYGKSNNRIYLQKLDLNDMPAIVGELEQLARKEGYTKIFAKIQTGALPEFISNGYKIEAYIPRFYKGKTDCVITSRFFDETRKESPEGLLKTFSELFNSVNGTAKLNSIGHFKMRKLNEADADSVSEVFKEVFETYPFPVYNPDYIRQTMQNLDAFYFGVWDNDNLIGVSTAETDFENENAEMTDFAVLPEYRGKKLAQHLLAFMEKEMKTAGIKTAYTIARLAESGMNKTFLNAGYKYSGTLVNNTNISGSIESMNIFYKHL